MVEFPTQVAQEHTVLWKEPLICIPQRIEDTELICKCMWSLHQWHFRVFKEPKEIPPSTAIPGLDGITDVMQWLGNQW